MQLDDALEPTKVATASHGECFFEVHFHGHSRQWSTYGWPIYDLFVDEGKGTRGLHGTGNKPLYEIVQYIRECSPDLPEHDWQPA